MPPSLADVRVATGTSVRPKLLQIARAAWLWAYRTHRLDDPSFTDWVNAAVATWEEDPDAAAARADLTLAGIHDTAPHASRMFYLDHDKRAALEAHGPVSAGLRTAIAAELHTLLAAADVAGQTIEPFTGRLPNKVWRT